ncbi:MAG: cytidine deaminase [Thermoanaerobaculaceae bacterium]|nr:cytidine deaminase [Thermoanaerobaculaceae bacterium]HPW55337.1 cytidine deaminase [Thermoanaerobaculaceae bacterium]
MVKLPRPSGEDDMELAQVTIDRLFAAARQAQANAWAPYSRFRVGAAVLAEDGRVFVGCNLENASFGLTVCAERNALAATVVAGAKPIAVAVVGPQVGLPPCGACRQVLAEFGLDLHVLLTAQEPPGYQVFTVGDLLPSSFAFEQPSLR